MTPSVLIVGASARAAAMSARRSGFEVWAADCFGDLDLQAIAACVRVKSYPADLPAALAAAPPGPWLYTGALENHPALVDHMAAIRPLCGVGGEALLKIRDPLALAAALGEQGYETVPRVLPLPPGEGRHAVSLSNGGEGSDPPPDGSWLIKPLASAAGVGIEPWTTPGDCPLLCSPRNKRGLSPSSARPYYLQQRIEGLPVAAVYSATGGQAGLLGVTRQLIGARWCGLERATDQFRYCGSIGPLALSQRERDEFSQLGNALFAAFPLVGLFGVDAILNAQGVWPVEVNPRYTASVEVLERALGIEPIRLHLAACGQGPGASGQWPVVSGQCPETVAAKSPLSPRGRGAGGEGAETHFNGKAILFARREVTIPPEFVAWCEDRNRGQSWPIVADIPEPGTPIPRGQPIVTLLAEGINEQPVTASLRSLAAEADVRID